MLAGITNFIYIQILRNLLEFIFINGQSKEENTNVTYKWEFIFTM